MGYKVRLRFLKFWEKLTRNVPFCEDKKDYLLQMALVIWGTEKTFRLSEVSFNKLSLGAGQRDEEREQGWGCRRMAARLVGEHEATARTEAAAGSETDTRQTSRFTEGAWRRKWRLWSWEKKNSSLRQPKIHRLAHHQSVWQPSTGAQGGSGHPCTQLEEQFWDLGLLMY